MIRFPNPSRSRARVLPALLTGALLVAPAVVLAQPGQHKHGHKHHGPPAAVRHDRHDRDWRNAPHDNGRHLGWYKQQWRRGERVPVVYLQPRYVIDDYRAYRLAPPPAGYGWVRPYPDSDKYLLVQLATGLIAQVLGY